MLLLFVPEFAAQQFAGVVRDLLQPLFQGLAMFTVQAGVARAQRRGGGLLIPQFAAWHVIAARLWRGAGLGIAGAGLALAWGRWLATCGTLPAGARLRSLAGLGGFVIFVFCRLGRLGLRLLLYQAFHQCLVFQGWQQIRLGFQRLLVGVDGRFQLTGPGQRVAAIVVGVGVAALGKALDGLGVVTRLVQRHALPLRVFEVFGGFGGAFFLQQVLALLVGAQPQVLEFEGIARLRRAQQQQWQAEQPATAPGAGRQQQQRQQQPVTLVGPGVEVQQLAVVAQGLWRVEHAELAQVLVVQARGTVAAAHFIGEGFERRAVEARH